MSSLRKKSCYSCIAAKRRCNKATPICERCLQRSLDCRYAFPPTNQAELNGGNEQSVGLHCATTDPVSALTVSLESMPLSVADSALMQSPNCAAFASFPDLVNTYFGSPMPLQMRALSFWPRLDDTRSWDFCAQTLLSFANQFVRSGTYPFIYTSSSSLPSTLTTAFGVCAAYSTRTDATLGIIQQLMINEAHKLAVAIPHGSVGQQLAALQALLLYHILMLFGGDARLQALAEHQESVLERATLALQGLDSSVVPEMAEAGLLRESARRAVLTSYLVRGIYRVLRYKSCHIIGDLVNLPVSLHPPPRLDTSEPQPSQCQTNTGQVLPYHEYVQEWEQGRLGHIDDFAQLLLVACKGLTGIYLHT